MPVVRRYSRQREAILTHLKGRCDHPSADQVYADLRETLPNLSLGTVYRNLNALSGSGDVLRFTVNGKEHFDGNITPHSHFICLNCGAILDIFDATQNKVKAQMEKELGCFVSGVQILVYGKCNACSK